MDGIFTDGGVAGRNPSEIGGSWAWCLVKDDKLVEEDCGYVVPRGAPLPDPAHPARSLEGAYILNQEWVSNNNTELIAIMEAVSAHRLRGGGPITLHSDSNVALGWVFRNWRPTLVPSDLMGLLNQTRDALEGITEMLLAGHPSAQELKDGMSRKRIGLLVSKWNKHCDHLCGELASHLIKANATETLKENNHDVV